MNMQQRIESTLAALQPVHLSVLDESHMHSRGLQTHFKAVLVSGKLSNVAALQAEYAALGEQKEKLYADYGKLKKQVKEYDVIKRNIDSILRRESEPERGKENVRG